MQILFNAFVTMPNQLGLISLNPNMVAMSFEKMLFEALKHGLISEQLSQPSEIWRYVILYLAFTPGAPRNEPLLASYDFEVFAPSSINIGLRHVYRQYWRPLAVQPGEVVRTIPLGPRQTMKVCTKIIQRSKTVTLTETQEEKETTTESATTTKDSSEVVKEASSTFNWNVEASVSGTYGYASGSLKAGMGGDSKDRSQQTSSKLNEAMQKTSTKLRQQSKISISTEQESTFEQTTATEITNPNDEIAVTYEYLKLQQQYELFTFLAEVDSVIYVAEQVPSASEVNDEWVRKYGWILAKVLLDDSYAPILREVVNELSDPDPMDGLDKDPFKELMDNATTRFAQFGAYNNLSDGSIVGTTPTTVGMSDIYSDPAKTYAEWLRSRAALKKANALRDSRWNRLFDHIRDNILHYCRAIWQNEDRDQRTLRYKKLGLTIPALWELDGKSYFPAIAYQNVTVPLHEAIDPTGPLGFFGNYAIYHLRQFDIDKPNESILSIFDMFAQLRHTYVNDDGSLRDPALVWEREHAKVPANLNDDIVRDVVYYLSRLKVSLLDENGAVLRDNAGKLQNPVSKNDWGEYLYRKKHTDRLLLDSNNLYIYLRPGKGSTMEPFKQAHRFIDVLKAKEEYEKLLLQNQQREQSLSVPGILDPDVQKVIIVDSKTGQISIAAAGISAGTPNS